MFREVFPLTKYFYCATGNNHIVFQYIHILRVVCIQTNLTLQCVKKVEKKPHSVSSGKKSLLYSFYPSYHTWEFHSDLKDRTILYHRKFEMTKFGQSNRSPFYLQSVGNKSIHCWSTLIRTEIFEFARKELKPSSICMFISWPHCVNNGPRVTHKKKLYFDFNHANVFHNNQNIVPRLCETSRDVLRSVSILGAWSRIRLSEIRITNSAPVLSGATLILVVSISKQKG